MQLQRRLSNTVLSLACLVAVAGAFAGCSHTHGNRGSGRPMVTKMTELRRVAGKQVTLVGTARRSTAGDSAVELRGGTVELPAYTLAEDLVDKPVMVTGTLIPETDGGGPRIYRLGEVEVANRWSK